VQHVFISYKSEDFDFTDNVIRRLEKEGFATWTDLKIGAGEEWRTAIDLAIRNAFALVVIMTPEAKSSEYVTYEWAFGLGVGVTVVPVVLRHTTLHPRLAELGPLDFAGTQSRPWDRLSSRVNDAARAPLAHSVIIPRNSPPVVREAVASLDSAIGSEREAAIQALVTARTPVVAAVLRESLNHPLPDVRTAAAKALGQIQDGAAAPALIGLVTDPDGHVREAAARALGTLGDPAAVPALAGALIAGDWADLPSGWNLPDLHERRAAASALTEISQDPAAVPFLAAVIPVLITALQVPDGDVSYRALAALEHVLDPAARPVLTEAIEDTDWDVGHMTAAALEYVVAPAAVPALHEALASPDQGVRTAAAAALERIGQPAVGLPPSQSLARHDEQVRLAARRAYDGLGAR
jgi:HEAT repeat protein